jgi:hypothetical protein
MRFFCMFVMLLGFQWRHWGATYVDADTDYSGQGIDQIQTLLSNIRSPDPTSKRRLLVSAWNVADLPKMALPPCHYSMEWAVDPVHHELSCKVTMRSSDLGLGNSYNVASYRSENRYTRQASTIVPIPNSDCFDVGVWFVQLHVGPLCASDWVQMWRFDYVFGKHTRVHESPFCS